MVVDGSLKVDAKDGGLARQILSIVAALIVDLDTKSFLRRTHGTKTKFAEYRFDLLFYIHRCAPVVPDHIACVTS